MYKKTLYPNGKLHIEEYFNEDGKRHNDNGAAYVEYYQNGKIKEKVYFSNGLIFNDKYPAHIRFHVNGNPSYEAFYKIPGKKHNDQGACIFKRDINGKSISISYYFEDKLSNLKGPAISGVMGNKYYIYGEELSYTDWLGRVFILTGRKVKTPKFKFW